MMGAEINYDGNEWQEFILSLLKVRYAAGQFVEVPDRVNGDCGIEGFSRDGCCFQCYAPEEPLTVAQRTAKIKAKITADLNKLSQNAPKLAALFGSTTISRWVAIVPRLDDKSVIEHAEIQAAKIRALGLSFIVDDFSVSVETLDNYRVEHGALLRAGAQSIRIECDQPTEEQFADWTTGNDSLVGTLDRKFGVLHPTNAHKVHALRNSFIRHYLAGQNALEAMRRQQPELYEAALQVKSDKEEFLRTDSLISDQRQQAVLGETIGDFKRKLSTECPGLANRTVDQLAFEAVADWLIRCPLDFEAE